MINYLNGEETNGTFYEKELQSHSIKLSHYFLKPYRSFEGNINVKVDLSNYATKADLKDATGIDTSNFALKSNLTSLKAEVDKIDIDNSSC